MSTLSAKVKYGFWFFRKGYINQLLFMLKNRYSKHLDTQSVSWCKLHALGVNDFFKVLGIKKHQIKTDFPQYFEYAKLKALECPFDMDKGSSPDVLYSLIKELGPRFIIETGVAYGWSSLAILLGIMRNSKAHLWSIDMPYPNLGNENYVGCVLPEDLHDKWTLIRKPDISGLPVALNECGLIDFFHYDSDFSYDGQTNAANMVWRNLRMGGYFMSTNIQNNQAFKDFCESIKTRPFYPKDGIKLYRSHKKITYSVSSFIVW